MALLFVDGFDKYGPPGQTTPSVASLLTAGEWTTTSGTSIAIVAGLSGTGYAVSIGTASTVTKTLAVNYSRLIGGYRFNGNLAASNGGIQFLDAGTAQASITINSAGTVSLRAGGLAGTAIATSSASVSANSTHTLEWDISFSNSAAYQVWLDGVSVFSGTADTTATVNNYANQITLGSGSVGPTIIYDDLYKFDNTGSTNNAVLLSNPIVETAFPSGDAQTQWTNGATIIGNDNSLTPFTNAPGANQIFLRAFTPPVNMTLNSVSCVPKATSASAKFKAVLYAGIATGSARIAEGTEVVGTISGNTLTAPFAAGQSLTGGVTYAIGFITDTSVVLAQYDAGTTGSKAANTYTSNSPSTLPTMTAGQVSWQIWGNCTGSAVNWPSLSNNPAIDDIAYAYSSTVNNEDHQSFPNLSNNPAAIYAVAYKARVKRSDSGTRTVDVRCQSGSANSAGTNSGATPGPSFGWIDTLFETDPNTGLAWTGSAVNAASAGAKVAS